MLQVTDLTKSFRGLRAVKDVSFEVPRGAIVALVGPNGAGKTTTFNLIAGAIRPDFGKITLDGRDITGLRQNQTCDAGIGRSFQIVRPFNGLSVLENVVIGALHRHRSPQDAADAAKDVLETLGMLDKAPRLAASLTLPEKKRLEVARAIATQPRLLLLDEVMAGLRPPEVDEMVHTLIVLRKRLDLTILLTEHVMRAVMALSQRVVVMHHGEKICEGTPEEIVNDPQVLESYLGHGKASGIGRC
jgi:branched-chain amino acid transport system ATP-binding protein